MYRSLSRTRALLRPFSRASKVRNMSYLEAERKFVPSPDFIEKMNAIVSGDAGSAKTANSSTWSVKRPELLHDTYYDYHDQLSRRGLWIRLRGSQILQPEGQGIDELCDREWNAKLRLGGDLLNSSFEEVQGQENVRNLLAVYLPHLSLDGLEVMADLHTVRRTWELTEEVGPSHICEQDQGYTQCFSIVLDYVQTAANPDVRQHSKFEHEVGEMEMTRSLSSYKQSGQCSETKEAELVDMHEHIERFMSAHSQLFSSGEARGKLSAYFDWLRSLNENSNCP